MRLRDVVLDISVPVHDLKSREFDSDNPRCNMLCKMAIKNSLSY
jgi:hypothetical protein